MTWTRRQALWVLTPAVCLAFASTPRVVFAWKPLTHADQARQAVAALPDNDPLKASLQANMQYVYAGSSGPDIYYALLFDRDSILGDLAHYCKTDALAQNLKRAAAGNPRLEALAFGWVSHIVADSVAHPWVNGFVGAAYSGGGGRSLVPGTINHLHGQLEAWVNRDFTAGMDQGAFTLAIWLYATDPDVRAVVGQAFQDTYGDVSAGPTCGPTEWADPRGEIHEITRRVNVEKATEKAGRWMARLWRLGAFASEPLLFGQDPSLPLRTAPEYLGLTSAYIDTSWLANRRLLNFNLDLGVAPGQAALEDLYGPVSVPGSVRRTVFRTPGTRFVPPDGDKPQYVDKCSEMQAGGEVCFTKPGGDTPDDSASLGRPGTVLELPGTADPERSFARLALKKGDLWPVFGSRLGVLGSRLEVALNAGDVTEMRALQAQIDEVAQAGASASSRFRDTYASTDRSPSRAAMYEGADVMVLRNGYSTSTTATIERFEEPVRWLSPAELPAGENLAREQPVLVVPTGGLYGLIDNEEVRNTLAAYVSSGGTVLVFAQQHGTDYSVLPTPDGPPIHAWGWTEDNSCYTNAAYIDAFHPILASQPQSLVTSNIDGFFDSIPDNATVLMRRVKNSQPAMFVYPYGQGWVIVSSSYDDWGGYNQSGPGARAIIRDAIAWAKKPADLPRNAPGSTAAITLDVKNVTELPASQAHLLLMSPSRDKVISEQTLSLSVPGNGAAALPFSYAFPANAELGIYHVDYELLDDAGVTIQPVAEEDSGRIVIATPPATSSYRASDIAFSTVMPGGETVLFDPPSTPVSFHYALGNRASNSRHFRVWWDVNHGPKTLAAEFDLAGNATFEQDLSVPVSVEGRRQLNIHVYEVGGTPKLGVWWGKVPGETAAYQLTDVKGFVATTPRANGTARADKHPYAVGETARVTVEVTNAIALPWDGTLALACGDAQFEQAVSVWANGTSSYAFSIPPLPVPSRLSSSWSEDCTATLSRQTRTLWTGRDRILVQAARLTNAGLNVPVWSRTATNTVTWQLRNDATAPLLSGTVRAQLTDQSGTSIWSEEQALALAAWPNGSGTVTFTIPPVPPGLLSGVLTVTADNGAGMTITASRTLTSSVWASARASAPSFSAGDSGEILVSLGNNGTLVAQGTVSGSIDGIGPLASQAFSVLPGQAGELRLPFQVPAAVIGGLHRCRIQVPGAPPVETTASIARPVLAFSMDDRVYQAGESVPVSVRNTGGSRSQAEVSLAFSDGPPVISTVTLEPNAQTTVDFPLGAALPSGSHTLVAYAIDRVNGAGASGLFSVRVAGTEALLTVATDRDVYALGAAVQPSAHLQNTGIALSDGGLHLEVAAVCAAPSPGETYHVDTWDGTQWVERATRHRTSLLETDQVDLGRYLPDPDGEYKIRIRQTGTPNALLDYVALVSGGSIVPLQSAVDADGGWSVDWQLGVADDWYYWMDDRAVVVTFPSAPNPSLLYRASEGASDCWQTTVWQKDVPLTVDTGASLDFTDAFAAWMSPGQYVLTGTVKTRDGDVLAHAEKPFQVVTGEATVTIRTDDPLYREGAPVPVGGTVTNTSAADASLTLTVSARTESVCASQGCTVYEQPLTLAAGGARDYAFTLDPTAIGLSGLVELHAVVSDSATFSVLAESLWTYRTGTPQVDVGLSMPDPPARLVPTSERLVVASEADLDGVMNDDAATYLASLPFPVTLGGVAFTVFSQSVDGFVELGTAGAGPTGAQAACLDGFSGAAVLAGFLGDLDSSSVGYVGHKLYPAGSQDRAGRVFPTDTLVFFWNAPAKGDTTLNTFQVLLTRDGLVRIDADPVTLGSTCARTGVVLPGSEPVSYSGPAPFGLRVETGPALGPFTGGIHLNNSGTYPGTVTLDYGRDGGTRTTDTETLAPGESRTVSFRDAVTGPTVYSLNVTGDAELTLERTVQPQGGLLVGYGGATSLAPGPSLLPVRLSRTGSLAGPLEVTFTLAGPGAPQVVTRTYDLEPDIPTADSIPFVVPDGTATLTATAGVVPVSMGPVALLGAPQSRASFTASLGDVSGGVLPIAVDVASTGLLELSGEVQVQGVGDSTTPIAVASGQSVHLDLRADLQAAVPGPNTLTVRLVATDGTVIGETPFTVNVVGPRVALVSSPAGQSFDTGQTVGLPFVVQNTGDQRALGSLGFTFFDQSQAGSYDIAPGAQAEIDLSFYLDNDSGQKTFAGIYTLRTNGLPDVTGQINFIVNGIALTVEGALDKGAYADGDTAHFTAQIQNGRPQLGTDYLVRVRYAGFDETRPVTVSGSTTVTFEVPLPQVTGETLFLGISQPDTGMSLYINAYEVRKADAAVLVTLDQQVYAPGSTVTVSATPTVPGALTLTAPGYSQTLQITGPVTQDFALPSSLPGGTYFVAWTFTPTSGQAASGSVPFDVAGVRVRVLEAALGQGRYGSGDTIQTTLRINTNQPASATLRAFVLDPEGASQLVGEVPMSLDPSADLYTTNSWPFASQVAGLHRLVYGIYLDADTVLASGSLAFDVGNAAVVAVRTDRTDYPLGTEPVQVRVTAFVTGPANLHLEVDGQPGGSQAVVSTGIVQFSLQPSGLTPGPHELAAVMDGGGYTSRGTTSFAYGTLLPDLVAGMPSARSVNGAAWKIEVAVSNVGRTATPATTLELLDQTAGAAIGSVPVSALAPGASVVVSADWNVLGLAGNRAFQATVDPGDAIVEFRKDNNRASASVTIPELVIDSVSAPSYPANVEAGLGASVTNLSPDKTYDGLVVVSSVLHPDGSGSPLAPSPLPPLGPRATATASTPWAVGRSAPGSYLLRSELRDAGGLVLAGGSAVFQVAPTPAFAGTVAADPSPASTGQPVRLSGHIENQGNVAVTGTARFDLVALDGTSAAAVTTPADVPLEGGTNVTATIASLDVNPGPYRLDLSLQAGDHQYPVAQSSLTVTGEGVEAALDVDLTPRVLVYVARAPGDEAGQFRRTAFVEASLQRSGVLFEATSDPSEFARLFRSGTWNTYVVMSERPVLLPLLADELREAVFRGDGFVLVQWHPSSAQELEEALGASLQGALPGKAHTLSVLAGPLGPAQTLAIPGPVARVRPIDATVAATMDGGTPALTVHDFGAGRSALLAFDPAVPSGAAARPALEDVFGRVVAYTAPRQPRAVAPGTVLPLAILLTNHGAAAASVDVTLSLPFGVRLSSIDDDPASSDPPTWQVSVPARASKPLRFQVVAPDEAGSYTVGAALKVNGVTTAGPAVFELSVAAGVADELAGVIVALEGTTVDPPERGHVQSAISLLRVVQRLDPLPPLLELRIRIAAEAAESLGRVHSADVSGERREVDRLISAWERAWYDWRADLVARGASVDPGRMPFGLGVLGFVSRVTSLNTLARPTRRSP